MASFSDIIFGTDGLILFADLKSRVYDSTLKSSMSATGTPIFDDGGIVFSAATDGLVSLHADNDDNLGLVYNNAFTVSFVACFKDIPSSHRSDLFVFGTDAQYGLFELFLQGDYFGIAHWGWSDSNIVLHNLNLDEEYYLSFVYDGNQTLDIRVNNVSLINYTVAKSWTPNLMYFFGSYANVTNTSTASFYNLSVFNRTVSELELAEQLTECFNYPDIIYPSACAARPVWANRETRAQANPQPDSLQMLKQDIEQKIVGKSGNYNSLFNQKGEQRKSGYYQSTVTVSDIPKPNTRILCFTNNGQLLDETYSNESGVYRFDHLLMDNKYLFVAQYNNGNPQIAPDYLAAAADWQTPTPYGS